MGLMDNMKVAYKLLVLNIIAMIGLLVIGVMGYQGVQTAKEEMEVMFNRNRLLRRQNALQFKICASSSDIISAHYRRIFASVTFCKICSSYKRV